MTEPISILRPTGPMNFAEELVYWYLRLNGFFPITNFVLHHNEANWQGDTDLVAVRFPHVSEDIGGRPEDWDPRFRNEWGIDLTAGMVGLIVEVKGGRWQRNELNDSEWHISYGLRRLGMIAADNLDAAVNELTHAPITPIGGVTSAKLLVANGRRRREPPWLRLELDDVDEFVRERMRRYQEKQAQRFFFKGDLIQYLAWKGGAANADGE
jgi:hypothetical protein